TIIWWESFVGTCVGSTILFCGDGFGFPHTPTEWTFLTLKSVCGVFGTLFWTLALKLEEAGPVALVNRSAKVLLAFVMDLTILGVVISLVKGIGTLIVFLGTTSLGLLKWHEEKPESFRICRDRCLGCSCVSFKSKHPSNGIEMN